MFVLPSVVIYLWSKAMLKKCYSEEFTFLLYKNTFIPKML